MIFKRLLGRTIGRTRAPEDRRDPLLIVRSDSDLAVRCDACRRITSLHELRELMASDLAEPIRETARARYGRLLCGREEKAPDLAARLAETAALSDRQLLAQVARDAVEAELRRAAIDKIADPAVLGACALEDALAANRSAAVDLLDDKQALEQVVKQIGKKDKRVYRAARAKLKEIAEREAFPARIRSQCDELCERLGRLGHTESWVQDRAKLELLDRQWAEIEAHVEEERKVRYRGLRDAFLAAFEAHRREHEAQVAAEESRHALRAERRALLEGLQALASSPLDNEAEVAAEIDRIGARWNALEALPASEQASLDRALAAARAQIQGRLDELGAMTRHRTRLGELITRAEQALEQSKPLDSKEMRALLEEARGLAEAKGVDKDLAARVGELRQAHDERLHKQKKLAEQRLAQLSERLDELAAAIEGGSLKEAEPLYQSVGAAIELIERSGLAPKDCQAAAARLKALAPRLRDLQKWRKWGTDQHRQQLCLAMEELIDQDLHPEALTLRLQDLQTEWKQLDSDGSPTSHPLWDRFHAASERVYERCKPYLEAQAAEREANRRQREQLCVDLEAFLDQADWERMDWKKAARAEREMRQVWSAMGPVEGRHRKALEKRFRNAMKRLDGQLAQERSRNQAHKRDLIAQVEALAEDTDLGHAIEEAKRLQRLWHTTVPARQSEENRLWQRFRAACDAIFERRKAQHEAHSAELADNLHQREGLCAKAEGLAAFEGEPDDLAAQLEELDAQWREWEDLPVPRHDGPGLTKRWRRARARVDDRRRELQDARRRETFDLLARQAAVCEEIERRLEVDAEEVQAVEPAAIEARWQALPAQRSAELQAAMERRFLRALGALTEGGDALAAARRALASDGARRAELCLHLEILARISSPPELAKERLQFQVTRLTEHMRDGEKDPLLATSRLLHEWYLCGPAPAAVAPALEARFLRARRAIEGLERENEAA